MTKELGSKIQQSAKQGVQKSQPFTSFVGMKSGQILDFLSSNYSLQIAQLLPDGNESEVKRIMAQASLVISQSEIIKACSPPTVVGCILSAVSFGLNPLPALNEVFFIPYGGKCTLQIGYKGWYKLLVNTGLLEYFIAEPVGKDEVFKCIRGSKAEIVHEQGFKMVTESTLIGAYAIAKLKGMGEFSKFLCKEEIEHLRKKGSGSGAWKTDYGAMAVVKAIKKLIHTYLPISDQIKNLQKASSFDNSVIDITQANMATKELIPVSTEEPENVEAETVEVVEVVESSDLWVSKTLEFLAEIHKNGIPKDIQPLMIHNICSLIENGTTPIEYIPNELLSIKEIENAVLTVEQNGIKA